MKKLILLLVANICSFHLWSQGTLQLTAGANIQTTGNAYIVLNDMHVVNNGSFQQTSGNGIVKFTGGSVNLSGSSITTINQLVMAMGDAASLNLQSNLAVVSNVTFSTGFLNLNNNTLDLTNTGSFITEWEGSRALTTGSGYVQATRVLNNLSSENVAGLGAMITSTANFGNTIIRRGHVVQTGVSGSNNSIKRYFDIIPAININLKAVLRFFYFDAELNSIAEATLHQYKSVNNINWDFVGADARSTTTNYVEKKSINKFDRVTLATATAPVLTSCQGNISTNASLMGCKASVAFSATSSGVPAPTITYRIGNTVITSPHVFSKGTTTVTATATNGLLPNATCSFTVTVVCGNQNSSSPITVVVEEQKESKTHQLLISARPNPSVDQFALFVKARRSQPVTVRIMDMLGRVIETRHGLPADGFINLGRNYKAGTYVAEVTQSKNRQTIKLIKL